VALTQVVVVENKKLLDKCVVVAGTELLSFAYLSPPTAPL